MASFSACREDHFEKRVQNGPFPSDFVKLGSKIIYLFFAEKGVASFVVLLQLCPILAKLKYSSS